MSGRNVSPPRERLQVCVEIKFSRGKKNEVRNPTGIISQSDCQIVPAHAVQRRSFEHISRKQTCVDNVIIVHGGWSHVTKAAC